MWYTNYDSRSSPSSGFKSLNKSSKSSLSFVSESLFVVFCDGFVGAS